MTDESSEPPVVQLPPGHPINEIIAQSARDFEAGHYVTDPRWPGARFSPGAAAALLALEIETAGESDE
jgi:hypothetical protein